MREAFVFIDPQTNKRALYANGGSKAVAIRGRIAVAAGGSALLMIAPMTQDSLPLLTATFSDAAFDFTVPPGHSFLVSTTNRAAAILYCFAEEAEVAQPIATRVVATPAASQVVTPEKTRPANHLEIASPMIGFFYRAISPDHPPFVDIGDQVKNGQTLCIIEAMKVMNEIRAEVDGRVLEILAQNGEAVEFGHPLFIIEPTSTPAP